jgi:alkanesulfonate monooxygenase SsuD/methylene tetrahydromethanopterin reductase-like flavin-dependent oxidoreductase (luciferase family)
VEISIGLPNTLTPPGPLMGEWARRAEERGFASVSTIDRIVYPTFDSLTCLAFAAGATSRIGLLSGVLLAPLYPPVWLAKAAASLDAMSGGRLTLGLGVGGRADDFAAMGRQFGDRGPAMDEALDLMHRAWAGETVGGDTFPVSPRPPAGAVRLLVGGNSDAAVRRTVRYGQGWIAGGGGPDLAAPMMGKVRQAWREAGRDGEPRFAALTYYGLGDDAASRAALRTYYGFLGERADAIVESVLRTPQGLEDAARAFEEVGVDELVFCPTLASMDQVDRLADAVLAKVGAYGS